MGMTNRVIPAQGEERGASYTLIRLDGVPPQKFQPSAANFMRIVHFGEKRGCALFGALR